MITLKAHAFEASPIPMVAWESVDERWQNCILLAFNVSAREILYPSSEMKIGATMGELFPEADDSAQAVCDSARYSKAIIHEAEGNGHIAYDHYRLNITPYGGNCALLSLEDITEQESARKRLAAELANKEQLLYFASHDLAEPLRHARAFVDMGREATKEPHADMLLNKATEALERAQRLLKSLNEHRKLSSLGRNGNVDVSGVIREVVDSLASFKESNAALTCGKMPIVRANRFALLTVFRNLFSNSIKYRKHGTIPSISVSAEKVPGFWLFVVEDNGIGFDDCHAVDVFRLGERLHSAGERWGDGIGLANVRVAVESQGGNVWAYGNEGVGARFQFTIPSPEDPVRGRPAD